jgi:hypothetical protein
MDGDHDGLGGGVLAKIDSLKDGLAFESVLAWPPGPITGGGRVEPSANALT